MKKVQFFSDVNIASLQIQVNEWLAINKNISIIETNLATVVVDELEQFTFYILYTNLGQKAKKPDTIVEDYKEPLKSSNIQDLGFRPPN